MAEFKSAYFARGAIKATVLTIDGNPADAEMKKLEAWWKRFFAGVSQAWQTAAVRAGVTPVVVGEGLESLSNSELTNESRQSIATALGVPHSIVAADSANFATAQQDELNFLNNCIIPESRLIERTLNRQMFQPVGLRFQFQPDRLSAMQEDEEQRANAYSLYVNAKIKPSIAAQLVGLGLPDGITYEMLDGVDELAGDGATADGESAKVAATERPILGYHIEQGVVTRNEARAAVGLPAVDETEDLKMRNLRALFELIGAGTAAGLPLETVAQIVGLSVQLPEPPPPPPPPQLPDNAAQRDEEVRRLKRWAKGKKAPDVDKFNSDILSREEKLIEVGIVEDATFPVADWGNYP
jgi:hypothetical protein